MKKIVLGILLYLVIVTSAYGSGLSPVSGGQIDLSTGTTGSLPYSSISGGPQFTSVPFNASDFFGSGSMTWTVSSGNVQTFQYVIIGNMMTINFSIANTSVGGTPDTALRIKIPAGKRPSTYYRLPILVSDNNGSTMALGTAILQIVNYIECYKDGGVFNNWAASSSNTRVSGSFTFSIQ